MAKRQRERPRAASPKRKAAPSRRRSAPARSRSASAATARHAQPAPPEPPPLRESYRAALALYERGLKALQSHDFAAATDLLQAVIDGYAEETDLAERAQIYLNVCARQATPPRRAEPQGTEERLLAATLALNAGDAAAALAHAAAALTREPANDHAHYVQAVGLTLAGRLEEAMASLSRAVELNRENRNLARQNADFDALRHDDRFRQPFDAATAPLRPEKRRPARSRASQ